MEWNNYKKIDAGCDKYGKQRLKLACYVRDQILSNINNIWFLENGTLLGAWRNKKFIDHDDDFDIAMLIDNRLEIKKIYDIISNLLIDKYKCRIVDTYCTKLEVYDPSYGNYILDGPKYNNSDYHYVTLDIQFYNYIDKDKYQIMYHIAKEKSTVALKDILPIVPIVLENEIINYPKDIELFLTDKYGSLDPDAKYCLDTDNYHLEII